MDCIIHSPACIRLTLISKHPSFRGPRQVGEIPASRLLRSLLRARRSWDKLPHGAPALEHCDNVEDDIGQRDSISVATDTTRYAQLGGQRLRGQKCADSESESMG